MSSLAKKDLRGSFAQMSQHSAVISRSISQFVHFTLFLLLLQTNKSSGNLPTLGQRIIGYGKLHQVAPPNHVQGLGTDMELILGKQGLYANCTIHPLPAYSLTSSPVLPLPFLTTAGTACNINTIAEMAGPTITGVMVASPLLLWINIAVALAVTASAEYIDLTTTSSTSASAYC